MKWFSLGAGLRRSACACFFGGARVHSKSVGFVLYSSGRMLYLAGVFVAGRDRRCVAR